MYEIFAELLSKSGKKLLMSQELQEYPLRLFLIGNLGKVLQK